MLTHDVNKIRVKTTDFLNMHQYFLKGKFLFKASIANILGFSILENWCTINNDKRKSTILKAEMGIETELYFCCKLPVKKEINPIS